MLLDDLAPWIDTTDAPRPTLPRRIAVIGRTSAGKTTLVNRLTGRHLRTGLGGVTRDVVALADDDHVWIDTPGIDGRDRALVTLGPVLDDAHGVLWVVDGLQPLTRTERDVVALLVPPGTPLAIVVSRADVVADDLAAVLDRVRGLTRDLAPDPILAAALPDWDPVPTLRTVRRTPDETDAWRRWLLARRADLHAARPLDPTTLAERVTLRPAVRAWRDRMDHRDVATQTAEFHSVLQAIADDAVIRWTADPLLADRVVDLPRLPTVPDPGFSTLDGLRRSAAGRDATARELRSLAASWVAEAELRLADWRDEQTFDTAALAAHAAVTERLSAELRELGHEDDQR